MNDTLIVLRSNSNWYATVISAFISQDLCIAEHEYFIRSAFAFVHLGKSFALCLIPGILFLVAFLTG